MKLTPIDITHRTFTRKVMGLSPEEVTAFLNEVASQMETLIHEKNHLKEIIRERELSLLEYKDRDKVLKDTITAATQMAERMRNDADREARLITADAQQKAEMITRDSRDSLKKIYQEMTELKKTRMQFEANLKALAQAHLALLEQGEKYMPQLQLPTLGMVENSR